jgi:hypothetical protein
MTRWEMRDGRVGYGLSEYLDQIIDSQPVGLAEQPLIPPSQRNTYVDYVRAQPDDQRAR